MIKYIEKPRLFKRLENIIVIVCVCVYGLTLCGCYVHSGSREVWLPPALSQPSVCPNHLCNRTLGNWSVSCL